MAIARLLALLLAAMGTVAAFAQATTIPSGREPGRIKGIFSDYQAWQGDRSFVRLIAVNRGATTQVGLFWPEWQDAQRPVAACIGPEDVVFEGACFHVSAELDRVVRAFTDAGVGVSGVIIGTPRWAVRRGCLRPSAADPLHFDTWCPPTAGRLADFRRFVRFVARRYSGAGGHGLVSDFVVGNEVNTHGYWNDAGCLDRGGGKWLCSRQAWIASYARLFTTAYDAIRAEQPSANVMVSLGNGFFVPYETVGSVSDSPAIAGVNFLSAFAAIVAPRDWLVAIHPYSTPLGAPGFSPLDYQPGRPDQVERGRVTFGNIGVVSGWLWAHYPHSPAANRLYLTEQGFSSVNFGSGEAAQADALCRSFRNALGTPSIADYVYHRLIDHPVELREHGIALGLWSDAKTPKAGWATWTAMDAPSSPACGFEQLPYVSLQRSWSAALGRHWASSRLAPPGYLREDGWRLIRNPADADLPQMRLLFECGVSERDGTIGHTVITADPRCDRPAAGPVADLPMGPVGYIFRVSSVGRVPLYGCQGDTDHFVSSRADCEGQKVIELLGYAVR